MINKLVSETLIGPKIAQAPEVSYTLCSDLLFGEYKKVDIEGRIFFNVHVTTLYSFQMMLSMIRDIS